jgi:hypothetical protein
MQLLRIASVLFILHICYHPRLYSAPIKDSSSSNNIEEETQTHSTNDEQHQAAVAEILNSTTFANITNSLLRSDSYNNNSVTNPLDLTPKRTLPYIIWISIESWANYLVFKQETCRTVKEEIPKFEDQDFLENGYFKWEENEFHRELRILLFPETSNTLKPLVENDVIDKLDKRFLQKPLESFCYQKETKNTKEEEAAEEKSKFEDIVLNRVFEPR